MPIKARFLLSTMKADDYAIYLDYVVLGQLIPVKNFEDLHNYELKPKEFLYIYRSTILKKVFFKVLKSG